MNYSLIPSWSKVRKPKFATYNARIEDIESKPTWRAPFKNNHCLVPVQSFIESCHFGDFQGHLIRVQAQEPLVAAGIYDEWTNKETGEIVESFAIITTEPCEQLLKAGHDRSPLFLNVTRATEWLNSVSDPRGLLRSLFIRPKFKILAEAKLKSF